MSKLNSGILSGMRVVEASAFVAAPLGGMTLAQMGAEVIRIDAIGGGLDYRRWPITKDNTSLFWAGLNKSKKSVAINFRDPRGAALAKSIITAPGKDAGILLTNFPPKGWLDFEELKALRQDLIQLTIQGDRHGGSAVDYTVNPSIGLPFLTGGDTKAANDVTNHVLPAWDCITGQMAALGILAAERHRSRSGDGQHIKLALADAAMAMMSHLGFIAEAQLGVERESCGNYLYGAFGKDFVCASGERVMIIGLTSRQWQSLLKATQCSDKIDSLGSRLGLDLRFEGARFEAREELSEIFAEWIGQRSYDEVQEAFDNHGVCWNKYRTVSQMLHEDPNCSTENPMFSTIEQQGVGSVLGAAVPLQFSAYERMPAQPAPALGAQTEEVLSEIVGLDANEIASLHDEGIVASADTQ